LFALGVLQIARGQLSKRAGTALGFTLSGRVLASDHAEHHLGGQLARVSQANGVGGADVIPARPVVVAIHDHERAVPGRLHAQG
jgi:hypothetical protein